MPLLAAIADSRQRFAKPVCALRLQLVWRGLMIVAIALMFSAVRAALRCAALRCLALPGSGCVVCRHSGKTAAAVTVRRRWLGCDRLTSSPNSAKVHQ